MKAVDWTKIYKKHRGYWVALKDPNTTIVVASGKTLKETLEKAKKKGVIQPLVTQIPREVLPIIGPT